MQYNLRSLRTPRTDSNMRSSVEEGKESDISEEREVSDSLSPTTAPRDGDHNTEEDTGDED